MADRFYGVVPGGQAPADVSKAAATTSRAVELRVDDASVPRASAQSKRDILASIEAIKLAVEQDDY